MLPTLAPAVGSAVIDRQVAQLTRLVDDLLDVSRITRGKIRVELEPVDVRTVVADALETVRPLIEARTQELTINVPAEPLLVRADVTRLSQVISNLLNNAAKFTPHRGHIWLDVVARPRDPADICSNGWVDLTVRDTGVGIAPTILPKSSISRAGRFVRWALTERTRESG